MTNSERRNCKKGEFVFRRGEPAIELYTIVSGQVRLFGTQRGKDVTVSILEPGTFFGEMALSGHHPPRRLGAGDRGHDLERDPPRGVEGVGHRATGVASDPANGRPHQ